MAQEDKDLKNKGKSLESKKSSKKNATGTNSTRSKPAKTDFVVEDAKKSLTLKKKIAEKLDKKKKESEVKGLTSYEEQALQGVTKSKGNKKILIIILLFVGLAVVAGVAIALFFVLRPEEDAKAIVCKVEVLSYNVDLSVAPEEYIVLGSGDNFNFTKETQETSSFTKDIDVTITDMLDFAMIYLVNNVTEDSYSYTLDFTSFEFSNCDIVVKVNNGRVYSIDNKRRAITISQFGDVVLEVRISGKNPPVFDQNDIEGSHNAMINWSQNTWCDGYIDLTLEVN